VKENDMITDNDRIAELVAEQIATRFGHSVEATTYEESRTRSGEQFFSLPIEQKHGIFDMIVGETHLKLRAGEVEDADNGKHTSVFVALHYEHVSGGRNGSNVGTFWFADDGGLIAFRAG